VKLDHTGVEIFPALRSVDDHNFVDSDVAIGESSEQKVSALVPCETGASNWFFHLFLIGVEMCGSQLSDVLLGEEVPNLDSLVGSENEPELLGGEEQAVNGTLGVSLSEEFTFNQVPDHGLTVLSS